MALASVVQPLRPAILFRALRPHQWVKNVLLFVPAFLAHNLGAARAVDLATAFLCFCLCASSVYLLNDIFDRHADRAHPAKRTRPVASGALPVPLAAGLCVALLAAGLLIALARLPLSFTTVLVLYTTLVVAYSLWLKYLLMVDVLCLAGFYTLRVFGGARAGAVLLSPWFLAFSTFLFFGLALVKRYTEIRTYREMGAENLDHRDYQVGDEQLVMTAGVSSGYLSVLVFYLYITDGETVTSLYSAPQWLWLIGPLLLYWFTRLWFKARRGLLDSDPVLFAVRDVPSWLAGIMAVACAVAATIL